MTMKQFTYQLTWTGTNPAPYLPNEPQPIGTATGTMAASNTIYTQILDVAKATVMDNLGLQVSWTGTPVGTVSVMASNDGVEFYALTFDPALGQPSGSADGLLIDINNFPFHYIMLQYTNVSGTGAISAVMTARSL